MQTTDSRRVAGPAPTKTASGRTKANAVDPSGLYTTSASSSFTVTAGNGSQPAGTVTSYYDGDGNVTSRVWTSGVTQTLTWDAFDRLIQVSQRDSSNNGYDWSAVYDGLGRRLQTVQQPVVNNVASGAATTIASIYDPQVEFLEIGVNVNGAKAWKVYGPDLNGIYGGLQGTGGLEATIMDGTGAATGVINDYFGNGVATISGGSVTWNTTKVGGYGPLPDSTATPLTDATQLAQSLVWRGHRIDPTGFYYLGARYYEPTSGRWMSADPLGFAGSTSLYEFCNGDPVNFFDPDGRVRWGALGSATLGLITNSLGVATSLALAAVPDPTLLTKVAAGTLAVKSGYGVGADAQNFYDALTDQDPISKGTLANDVAQAVAPGNQTAQQAATVIDLATDLATGRIASNVTESSNQPDTVGRDDYGMPVYNTLYQMFKDPGTVGTLGDLFTTAALAETGYEQVYDPLNRTPAANGTNSSDPNSGWQGVPYAYPGKKNCSF